jgi:heme/copper-type cytochrome/quinol oxidase subunit 4
MTIWLCVFALLQCAVNFCVFMWMRATARRIDVAFQMLRLSRELLKLVIDVGAAREKP